MYNVIIVHS